MKKSTVREVDSIEIVQKGAFINFTLSTELDFCSIWSGFLREHFWRLAMESGLRSPWKILIFAKGPETVGLHGSS